MEQSVPEIARKIWQIMRVAFFMLRKGICKRKILMDLNLMMKRGKIAGKALNNLIFHHHHHGGAASSHQEYEFSCSNTPLYRHYFRKHHHRRHHYEAAAASPYMNMDEFEGASPILPGLGFGQSPLVRQLRITDSPFPALTAEEDTEVDMAAEEFIQKFYSQLKQQQKYY